jgi:hypothetical protein
MGDPCRRCALVHLPSLSLALPLFALPPLPAACSAAPPALQPDFPQVRLGVNPSTASLSHVSTENMRRTASAPLSLCVGECPLRLQPAMVFTPSWRPCQGSGFYVLDAHIHGSPVDIKPALAAGS